MLTPWNRHRGVALCGVHFDIAKHPRPRCHSQINVPNLLEVPRIQHQQAAFLITDELCPSIGVAEEMFLDMRLARIERAPLQDGLSHDTLACPPVPEMDLVSCLLLALARQLLTLDCYEAIVRGYMHSETW
jgi:hypothetical protein